MPSSAPGAVRNGLLGLQATAGNAAVVRLLRRAAEDRPSPDGPPAVQRSTVHQVLRAPGRPLDDRTRGDMEARLGADFSDVRLHTGAAAKDSAAEVGARAYTSGSHIVIGEGGADRHTLAHELTHVIQQRRGPVAGTDRGDGLSISDPSDRFEREAEANAHRALSGPGPRSAPPGQEPVAAGRTHHPAVQRFMAPEPSGPAAEWEQAARAYLMENWNGIATRYTRVVLGSGDEETVEQADLLTAIKKVSPGIAKTLAQVKGNAAVEAGKLSAALRGLNIMEEETALATTSAKQDMSTPVKEVLVGTEFTFSDDVLNGQKGIGKNPPYALRVDIGGLTGVEDASAQRTLTYARTKATAWSAAVRAAGAPGDFTLAVTEVTVKGHPGTRFTYTNGTDEWWWEITLDDGCLETRTSPLSIEGLGANHIRTIIRTHIFDAAASVGLTVDQTKYGGGGHLSLDGKTAFGGSVELFVESMRKWETDWEEWKRTFGAAPRESDTENAPWTGDLPDNPLPALLTLLDEIRARARAGETDLAKAIRDLQAHLRELPLHADASRRLRDKVQEHPGDRLHYQAVNLEHMGEDTPADQRRVEFRDIQAQRDYAQLLTDLSYLGRLLQGVRMEVQIEQGNRLADRHAP
ncbi:DUF4157 domain-containing protein [Kitasatospora sp. NPDC036755]|uniref:eCIS core domain-containing protein n=1 Tax=Kitasatospora sp. NPDC036755 TaxID=3154600 RepID=UPI0033FEF3EC